MIKGDAKQRLNSIAHQARITNADNFKLVALGSVGNIVGNRQSWASGKES